MIIGPFEGLSWSVLVEMRFHKRAFTGSDSVSKLRGKFGHGRLADDLRTAFQLEGIIQVQPGVHARVGELTVMP